MFAVQESGVKPDILVIAKGLGNGFPISGIISRTELTDRLKPGSMVPPSLNISRHIYSLMLLLREGHTQVTQYAAQQLPKSFKYSNKKIYSLTQPSDPNNSSPFSAHLSKTQHYPLTSSTYAVAGS
jgi:hypothetical protein